MATHSSPVGERDKSVGASDAALAYLSLPTNEGVESLRLAASGVGSCCQGPNEGREQSTPLRWQ